jgi:hypothetical protein
MSAIRNRCAPGNALHTVSKRKLKRGKYYWFGDHVTDYKTVVPYLLHNLRNDYEKGTPVVVPIPGKKQLGPDYTKVLSFINIVLGSPADAEATALLGEIDPKILDFIKKMKMTNCKMRYTYTSPIPIGNFGVCPEGTTGLEEVLVDNTVLTGFREINGKDMFLPQMWDSIRAAATKNEAEYKREHKQEFDGIVFLPDTK